MQSSYVIGFIVFLAVAGTLISLWMLGYFEPKKKRYAVVTVHLLDTGVFLTKRKTTKEPFVSLPDLSAYMHTHVTGETDVTDPLKPVDGSQPVSYVTTDFVRDDWYECSVAEGDVTSPFYRVCNDISDYTELRLDGNLVAGVIQDKLHASEFAYSGTDMQTLQQKDVALGGPMIPIPQSYTIPTCEDYNCRTFVPHVDAEQQVTKFVDVMSGADITGYVKNKGYDLAKQQIQLSDSVPVVKERVDYIKDHFKLEEEDDEGKRQLLFKAEKFPDSIVTATGSGFGVRPGKHFSGPEILEPAFILAIHDMEADGIELEVNYKMEASKVTDMMKNVSQKVLADYNASTSGAGGGS
jgi:hypothetical protein